jgi:hypothetical protein
MTSRSPARAFANSHTTSNTIAAPMPICLDGPLAGEVHDEGESFVYDGQLLGEESGRYELTHAGYRWESDEIMQV